MADYILHGRLGFRVSRLARIMQSRLEAQLAPLRLTRLMWCALTGIEDEGVTNPSDLAEYIGVTRPAMSRILRGLEARGCLARAADKADGRARTLALTDEGKALHREARRHVDAQAQHFRSKISPAEHDALLKTLGALAKGEIDTLAAF